MATTIYIPIDIRNPQVASNPGNSFFNVINLSNVGDVGVWDFVKSVQGNVFGFARLPPALNINPNARIILTFMANATTGITVVQVATKTINTSTSFNTALVSETKQNKTVPGTAYQRFDVTFNLTNQPATDDEMVVEIMHNGTDGAETLAVDLLLVDAVLAVDIA